MTDTAQIVAWTAAICTPLAALVGVLCTKGVDGWIKLRTSKHQGVMEDRQYEDRVAAEAYALFKDAMTTRVEALEKALLSVTDKLEISRQAHAKCEVETEKVRGDLRVMQEKINRLEQHDVANKEQVKALAEAKHQEEVRAAAEKAAAARQAKL